MNLVTNALEAIQDEGKVSISTCNQQIEKGGITDHGLEPGNYLVLAVEDDGSGIAAKDLEHIFEPFYTKKVMGQSGTGLGLAVVWNTVQDHNGRIFVDSSEQGTTFQVYFPVTEEKEADPEKTEIATNLSGNNEHLLVVDDEPQLRDIATKILQNLGYKVDSVCSGELAIQFIQDNPVDLIVLDMLMEPGMNGRQTYEAILKLQPEQKAIIASGFSESDDVKATLQLGASGFIKKPYSMEKLGRAIQKSLTQ
jgi:CheY-like chemotaxis protein